MNNSRKNITNTDHASFFGFFKSRSSREVVRGVAEPHENEAYVHRASVYMAQTDWNDEVSSFRSIHYVFMLPLNIFLLFCYMVPPCP